MDAEVGKLESRRFRVTAPHFCAGGTIIDHRVAIAAPILTWMLGKGWTSMKAYCLRKGWKVEES